MNGQILKDISQKLDKVLELLTAPKQTSLSGKTDLIEVSGMQAPWVLEGLRWDGMHEARDQQALTDFLGFNPNDADGGKPWCAGFWLSIFKELGFDVSGLNLMATSFKDFGYELPEVVDGAICVFEPHEESDFPIKHMGVVVDDCTKLFGGNQGNSAKRSNLAWYMENAQLTAIRCPHGYKLV